MARYRNMNLVKVYLSDREMAELSLSVQYLKLTGQGPQTLSDLMLTAFKEWLDRRPDVRAYINANLLLIERARSQQGQQAAQEGGP